MGTIHRVVPTHLNECILAIKWRLKGSRLPSEEEVLIIRPTGKRVKARLSGCAGHPFDPGPLPGRRHSKAGSERRSGFRRNAVTAEMCRENDSQKSHFPKFQGAL